MAGCGNRCGPQGLEAVRVVNTVKLSSTNYCSSKDTAFLSVIAQQYGVYKVCGVCLLPVDLVLTNVLRDKGLEYSCWHIKHGRT